MAFEAYLTQDKAKPSAKRRLIVGVSLAVHGLLLAGGVVYSFWHVDEVSPPTVTVTFLANAPPPPPPPAAAKKKRSDSATRVVRQITQPKPGEIVQPKEKQEKVVVDDDDGVEGGVEGGVAGGVVGGVVGGTGTAPPPPPAPVAPPAPPKFVSPAIGSQQLLINPRVPPYRVVLPPAFAQTGMRLWAMLQICVAPTGNVSSVSLIKGMDPKVDPLLQSKVRTWRYKPMTVDGAPVPFCYRLRYEHQT